MTQQTCLLRKVDEKMCAPRHPARIALEGYDGKGGRLANAAIPLEYRNYLLEDSPAKASQEKAYTSLAKYVASFEKQFADVQESLRLNGKSENEIRIKSLYLWSESPGTGKTTTASALLNEYLVVHFIGSLKRGEMPKQRPVYFLDVNALQTKYNEFNRPRVPEDIAEKASRIYYNAIEKAKNTDLVVLDDIGVRKGNNDGWRGDLHSVIDFRVANRKPTIYTSNIPIEGLPEVFDEERLADRVRDMTQEIHFAGESRRGKRK